MIIIINNNEQECQVAFLSARLIACINFDLALSIKSGSEFNYLFVFASYIYDRIVFRLHESNR